MTRGESLVECPLSGNACSCKLGPIFDAMITASVERDGQNVIISDGTPEDFLESVGFVEEEENIKLTVNLDGLLCPRDEEVDKTRKYIKVNFVEPKKTKSIKSYLPMPEGIYRTYVTFHKANPNDSVR